MYTKDGEKYFIVDSHMHYWDATPANWVPGAEQYAKGWIECFHAYQSLGPKETHWPIEKFEGYTEDDLMKDVFEDGHVDIGDLPADVPEGVVHARGSTPPSGTPPWRRSTRASSSSTPGSTPVTATWAWRSSAATSSATGPRA